MKKSILLLVGWIVVMVIFFGIISMFPKALTPETTSLFGAISFAILVAYVVTAKREREAKKYNSTRTYNKKK